MNKRRRYKAKARRAAGRTLQCLKSATHPFWRNQRLGAPPDDARVAAVLTTMWNQCGHRIRYEEPRVLRGRNGGIP